MQPRAIVLWALPLGLACSASHAPPHDAGPIIDPRAHLCAPDGSVATPPPFSTMEQLFTENCISCHTGGPQVDLSAGHAWDDLVGKPSPAPESCGGILVVPGDPERSYLYEKLSSMKPCFGSQMPFGEFAPDPLPSCVVDLVRRWIAAGALDGRD